MNPLRSLAILCLLATGYVHASNTRMDFLKVIDRPRVPFAAQVQELPTTNGILQFHFSFATDASNRVPGILMESTNFQGAGRSSLRCRAPAAAKPACFLCAKSWQRRASSPSPLRGRPRSRVGHHTADARFGQRQTLPIRDPKLRSLLHARFWFHPQRSSGQSAGEIQIASRDAGAKAAGRVQQGFHCCISRCGFEEISARR